MTEAGKYLLVYFTGAAGIWKGIPLGIALNLQSFLTGLLTALGSITTVLILYFAGDSVRQWILKKYGSQRIERKKSKFINLLNRFGFPVLGLIAPGLLGPVIPLLMGLIFVKDTRRFIIYLITGIVLWSFILAFLFTPIFDLLSNIKD
jgi:membrane protein DedA with SNARE-associated domain